ncbi:hypothetical protein HYU94_02070 [Candidatus Daviesbacteria bacterium]|nr:hypothetical protein [Candidatus Daviesbacteria bacterium]
MDNQNNPNSQNQNPASSSPSTPPASTWPPPPSNPWGTAPFAPPPPPEPTPSLPQDPIQPPPTDPAPLPSSVWPSSPPIQSEPAPLPSSDQTSPSSDTWPTPNQPKPTPSAIPNPMPTFTPPETSITAIPTPNDAIAPTTPDIPSPLDNPLGAPVQPPSIDNPQASIQPSWSMSVPPAPTESAPTDLSHLITNNPPSGSIQPAPEVLMVPPTATAGPEIPTTLPTTNHKSMPRWVIGLGIGLLILVIGATAYFILGIGQPSKTISLPATTTPPVNNAARPAAPITTPAPTVQPSQQPTASDSASNFGELGGSAPSPATGSSSIDLLRQRQQGR